MSGLCAGGGVASGMHLGTCKSRACGFSSAELCFCGISATALLRNGSGMTGNGFTIAGKKWS